MITHVLLTRSPLNNSYYYNCPVRLACLIHAASVRSEPESNSPKSVSENEILTITCQAQEKLPASLLRDSWDRVCLNDAQRTN